MYFSLHLGRGVPILFLIDSADLELPVLDKSFEASMQHDDDSDADSEVESCSLKLALVPSSYLWSHNADTAPLDLGCNYFCLHDFGIHHVRIPWVNDLRDLCSSLFIEANPNSGELYSSSFSIARGNNPVWDIYLSYCWHRWKTLWWKNAGFWVRCLKQFLPIRRSVSFN